METVIVETCINAPLQRCFDAARDLDLHVQSLAHTGETAVLGRIAEKAVLRAYLERLLTSRAAVIKRAAEEDLQ